MGGGKDAVGRTRWEEGETPEREGAQHLRSNLADIIIHHIRLSVSLDVDPRINDLYRLRDTRQIRSAHIRRELRISEDRIRLTCVVNT